MFGILLLAGAGAAVIGHQIGNPMALLAGVVLVALTLWVGWLRRPHAIDGDGRWTCKNGHSSPGHARRCRMGGCSARR